MASLPNRVVNRIKRQGRIWRHRYLDNYVFVHINKTGETSIVKALNLPGGHKTAIELRNEMGPANWDKRFSFAVVRNPWDKVVSHYHYRVQTNQTDLGDKEIAFPDWVVQAYGEQNPKYYDKPKMFLPQTEWCCDETGKNIVTHFCRFENLNTDFDEVCGKIGKVASLPHLKSSKRGDYRAYYDEASRAVVEERFASDIAEFGYTFE